VKVCVVGAGAWGTALADLLARNGAEVLLWAYEPDVVHSITHKRENERFLGGVTLDEAVVASGDLGECVRDAELVVWVAPSHVLRQVARSAAVHVGARAVMVVASKGIERGSLSVMTDVVEDELPGRPVVALTGPSFASEVAARQPTAVVAASANENAMQTVQRELSNDHFRVYTDPDVVGAEVGGALKNVIAIATGIAEGLGLGYNSRAALITRGLAEVTRLGVAMGASARTFAGLAGLGDMVLTCTGALSRNRALGVELGSGRMLSELLAERDTVAEGVITAECAQALARREGVNMPITSTVYRILFENHPVRDALTELMTRDLRAERDT
jgi:glycerol-3-phosphate dehydrogenase (NAD(P)+)